MHVCILIYCIHFQHGVRIFLLSSILMYMYIIYMYIIYCTHIVLTLYNYIVLIEQFQSKAAMFSSYVSLLSNLWLSIRTVHIWQDVLQVKGKGHRVKRSAPSSQDTGRRLVNLLSGDRNGEVLYDMEFEPCGKSAYDPEAAYNPGNPRNFHWFLAAGSTRKYGDGIINEHCYVDGNPTLIFHIFWSIYPAVSLTYTRQPFWRMYFLFLASGRTLRLPCC